jgi:hypothetical protein
LEDLFDLEWGLIAIHACRGLVGREGVGTYAGDDGTHFVGLVARMRRDAWVMDSCELEVLDFWSSKVEE